MPDARVSPSPLFFSAEKSTNRFFIGNMGEKQRIHLKSVNPRHGEALGSESQSENNGGKGGIRTLVTCYRKHAFQACAFSHSATFPHPLGSTALKRSAESWVNHGCPRF